MSPKVKTILTLCIILIGIPVYATLLVLLRDFINLFIFVVTSLLCLGLTSYGLYEVVFEEMNRRHVMHEQLYHGKSKEVQKWLDFFLDYFGDEELE